MLLQQFPEQLKRCGLTPALLHEDIEHLGFFTNDEPHEHLLAADPHPAARTNEVLGATWSDFDLEPSCRNWNAAAESHVRHGLASSCEACGWLTAPLSFGMLKKGDGRITA